MAPLNQIPSQQVSRTQWRDLPRHVRDHVQAVHGGVVEVHRPPGGHGDQIAATLVLEGDRRVFIKGSPDDHRLTRHALHEAAVLKALPSGSPAPELLGVERVDGWTLVVISHLDGDNPDFRPGSPDLNSLPGALAALVNAPASQQYQQAVTPTARLSLQLHGWRHLAVQHPGNLHTWAVRHLAELVDLENAWRTLSAGDRIVHADLRADNMVTDTKAGVAFVDWAHATVGPAYMDAASLAPQLILSGHDPHDVADLLASNPLTGHREGVDAFLAALTGHWERNSRQPAPPNAPGLRGYQRRAAAAGRALLAARLK